MLYIDNIGNKKIRIRETEGDKTLNRIVDFATWKATIGAEDIITLKDMRFARRLSSHPSHLIINGQAAPTAVEQVIEALDFIGSYGTITAEDIQQIADIEIDKNIDLEIKDIQTI